jgi:hypothetical protein
MDEYVCEIDFALQNWGIKNELRLFGTEINEYYDPQKKYWFPMQKDSLQTMVPKNFLYCTST